MRRPRLLVIDDNVAFAQNLEEILEDAGYDTDVAHTGRAALDLALQPFDVALVDLRLPDDSGTELAAHLRDRSPDAQVVLLTGYATLETAIAAVRAGAFAYLVKPCATPELLLTVEQALRQVRLHAEKRELARRAQVAEKLAAVGTMTAGLSHEIRNPLNAATLQLFVLERAIERLTPDARPPLLAPLKLVQSEIQRLEHLLQDFLRFARPRELNLRPLQLAPIVEAVSSLLDVRQLGLRREVEPGLTLLADGDRVQQILMNLLLNAIDAARTKVAVSAWSEEREAVIAIEDDGPGIPDDVRGRIFEPFFTTKPAGTGLGLPIVHALVTQHGGHIDVERAEPHGARFVVRLPLA